MAYRVRGPRLTRRYGIFCTVILVLFLAACGGADDTSKGSDAAAAPPTATPNPAPTASPGEPGPTVQKFKDSDFPGLPEYIEECRRLNREFEEANIIYNATEYMRRGDAHTIEAAVTLQIEVPPQKILESEEAIGRRVRVSCAVEAELRASKEEFDIQEQGWQSQSLLTSPTARWTWSVTPKRGGTHELVLAVRPVITLDDDSATLPSFEASTQRYQIAADVSVTPYQRLIEGMDRLASLLTSAQGMVVAFTALVSAIIALRLTIRRRRAKSLSNNSDPPP